MSLKHTLPPTPVQAGIVRPVFLVLRGTEQAVQIQLRALHACGAGLAPQETPYVADASQASEVTWMGWIHLAERMHKRWRLQPGVQVWHVAHD